VTMATGVVLSDLRRRDLRMVMSIERKVFPEPWSTAIFSSELALREGRSYRAARIGRKIVGYLGLMFVGDEAHVTTVAVDGAHQRQGIATLLLLDAVAVSLRHQTRHISLEVAAGNNGAQALYRRFGFVPVGVRKGYYQLTGEDAFVMWAYGIDTPEYAARIGAIDAAVRSRS
jgi:[ribosomal protein S18]-alanine N-acetyltransferase